VLKLEEKRQEAERQNDNKSEGKEKIKGMSVIGTIISLVAAGALIPAGHYLNADGVRTEALRGIGRLVSLVCFQEYLNNQKDKKVSRNHNNPDNRIIIKSIKNILPQDDVNNQIDRTGLDPTSNRSVNKLIKHITNPNTATKELVIQINRVAEGNKTTEVLGWVPLATSREKGKAIAYTIEKGCR